MIKVLEMGRISCIIQVGSKYSHSCPYTREAEGDLTHTAEKVTWRWRRERSEDLEWCGHKPRNAGSHQKLEQQGMDSLLEPLEGVLPTAGFQPSDTILYSVLQIYEKVSSVVLGPKFVVISYGSHWKLIWPGLAISALVSLTTIKVIKKAKLSATSEPFHLFFSHRGALFPIASLGWLQEAFPDLWPKPN